MRPVGQQRAMSLVMTGWPEQETTPNTHTVDSGSLVQGCGGGWEVPRPSLLIILLVCTVAHTEARKKLVRGKPDGDNCTSGKLKGDNSYYFYFFLFKGDNY